MRSMLVVVLCLSMACDRGGSSVPLQFDQSLETTVAERTNRAMSSQQMSASIDAFFDSVVADPRVAQAGERLANDLMADPALAGAIETLMTRLGESPQVMAALQELMAQHPDASPEEIGDLFGKQFETRWDTPAVSAAWFAAWDAYVEKLGQGGTLDMLYKEVVDRFVARIDDAELNQRITKRIIALNGGERPDKARATKIYVDHAWNEDRIARIANTIVTNPTVRTATATYVTELLRIDAFSVALKKHASALVTNPDIQARVLRAMHAVLGKDVDIAEVRTSLTELLTHKDVVASTRELLALLVTNDKARALAAAWYETVRKDAALVRELRAFMTDW
jgi:hypothetical protein